MNLRRVTATLLASSIVVAGTISSASAARLEPNVIDSQTLGGIGTANVAVDRNGVVWANPYWDPMERTTKLDRFRVSSSGTLSSMRGVKFRGLNPVNLSIGRDGRLFLIDSTGERFAVLSLSRNSTKKKMRVVSFLTDDIIWDVTSDSSGNIYVVVADGVFVLPKNARNNNAPILQFDVPFQGDVKSVTVTDDGLLFVADRGAGAVYVFGPGDTEPIRTIRINSDYAESGPIDVEIGPDGLLYVAYSQAGIASFNLTANGNSLTPVSWITTSFDADFLDPQSIDFDANNHMIVGDFQGVDGLKVLGLPVG
jgi:streptogramin lyase